MANKLSVDKDCAESEKPKLTALQFVFKCSCLKMPVKNKTEESILKMFYVLKLIR